MAATPNELYAECLARPGDWAWEADADWYDCDDRGEPLAAPGAVFRSNPHARPCQVCGSDFYWQDRAGALWCIQCVDPPSVAMVARIWQVVVCGGQRGAVEATHPCLEIWRQAKSSIHKNSHARK